MKKVYLSICLMFIGVSSLIACPNITPNFTYTNSHTCGVPGILSLTNTSTGTSAASLNTKYLWKAAGKIMDTTWGLASPSNILLTQTGNHTIELVAIDSNGCRDSNSTIAGVTTNAPMLKDLLGGDSHEPEWLNCIQFRSDGDTFKVQVRSSDTLYNPTVIWGDGSANSSSTKLTPGDSIDHFYTKTGIFTYKVILFNSSTSCTDTLYGTVINQRQPTAGITGPSAGMNRGCAPHTITFKNSSYNVTKETKITWLFGDGEMGEQDAIIDPDSISHTYTGSLCGGIVTLKASNACGQSQTTWNPIDISEKDIAIIGADTSNCDPKVPFIFHNQSTDLYCNNPDPKQYYWDFGDGDSTGWIFSKASQSHVYDEPGPYTVMLIAKNTCGNDTTYFSFTTIFTPEPNFVLTDSLGCQPVTITASDISKGYNTTRLWDFGDGNTSTDSSATNIYNVGGDYTLNLSVTNSCGTVDTSYIIRVFDVPQAKALLRGQGCVPYNQSFTNNSTTYSDSTSYHWDFGDGTSSTDIKPASKLYSTPGIYNVILKVTNSCGSNSDTARFEVFAYPNLTLSGDSTVCTFDSFALKLGSNLNSTYDVKWGDGSTNAFTDSGIYKHVYQIDGLKNIIVTAKGPGGCPTTDTFVLNVKPGALAKFNLDKTFACAPTTFNVTNLSKNSTDYWWYVNGNLTSTSSTFNAYSINTDSTLVTLKLKTINSGFCYPDSMSIDIFTPNKPQAEFSQIGSAACGPFLPLLTNTSLNAKSYLWSFGNGTQSTSITPSPIFTASLDADTTYLNTLVASNWAGCKDTTALNLTVYPKPSISFTTNHSEGCGPLAVNFTNTSIPNDTGTIGIMNFSWNFGNGTSSNLQNSSSTFSSSLTQDSTFAIKLIGTSEHQCKDSLSSSIKVFPKPVAKFTTSVNEGCAPLNVNFTNLSIPNDTGSIDVMTFDWYNNQGTNSLTNPSSIFMASSSKDTVHKITLIAKSEHGCLDTTENSVKVFPKPLAKFNVNMASGCTPLLVNYTNLSAPKDTGSIQIMTFDWDLGNGSSSSVQSPSSNYISQLNLDSNYNTQLIATSEHGCKDTTSTLISVHPRPKVEYIMDKASGCGPLTVNFQEQITNGNQYFWNFGNGWVQGASSETQTFNPILLFDTVYRVQLTSTSINGCSGDTISKPIRVLGLPEAKFQLSKDTSCNNEVTLFYNTSLAAISYNWSFGDNTGSNLINPTKVFTADNINGKAITYTIKLAAKSVFGCSDTATQYFTAVPLPQAKIALDKKAGCGDLNINFTNATQYGLSQKWHFGEGTVSTIKNPNFIYTNNTPTKKQYVVTLESFSTAGCNAIDTSTITVFPSPFINANASRTNVCDSGHFNFIIGGSNIHTLDWEFGDNSPSQSNLNTSSSYGHYFPTSTYGDTSFITTIIATSTKGCKDSTTANLKLEPKVIANFDQTPNNACVPAAADFTNLSRNATNFVWEFGDGGGSGDINPSYIYNKAGIYSVKLTAFDKNGCRSIKYGNNNFEAKETPIAEFVMSPGQLKLPNAKAVFSNLTVYSSPTTFEWDFGDGSPLSSALNPVHDYVDTGSYKVKLLATNSSCKDVIIKQIIVDPSLPIVDFDPEGAVGCAPLAVHFKEKSQFAHKFTWHFGDGHSSTEANPHHIYENNGFYTVTLIAEGPGGTSKIIKTNIIEVKITPRCYFYASPDSAHLPNARFDMENKTINASFYSWQVNKSDDLTLVGTSTLKDPSFIINEVGNYNVQLIAVNNNQCEDTLSKPLLLIVLEQGQIYIPTAFTPNRDNINDEFKPVMLGVKEADYSFRIYDRWGGKIFETKDKKIGWDGTIKQDKVAESVFVWTISGKFADGTYFNKKGTVTLLR